MKKLFASLALLVATSAMSLFAQSNLVATLIHEGTVTAYYSGSAFVQAYNAAANGDTIMLSSGSFRAVNISKSLTIVGSGMHTDSLKNIFPTKLAGDFSIGAGETNGTLSNVKMEGIYHNGIITMGSNCDTQLQNCSFSKSRFREIQDNRTYTPQFGRYMHSPTHLNTVFANCIITYDTSFDQSRQSNISFINSVVHNPDVAGSATPSMEFVNCIYIHNWKDANTNLGEVGNSNFTNCLIITDKDKGNLPIYANANRCVSNYNCFGNITDNTNAVVSGYTDLFKTYTGTYSDWETFELTDEAKTKYLGIDGTEVGIYGGYYPFSPETTMPKISKFNVAKKSTADGKLSVDIEVVVGESGQ